LDFNEGLVNPENFFLSNLLIHSAFKRLTISQAHLSDFKGDKPFAAMSPPASPAIPTSPAYDYDEDGFPEQASTYNLSPPPVAQVGNGLPHTVMAGDIEVPNIPFTAAERFKLEQLGDLALSPASVSTNSAPAVRPYISKIGVLPTSLPHMHRAYMEARNNGNADEFLQPAVNSDISDSQPQSTAEQALPSSPCCHISYILACICYPHHII